MNIFTLNRRRQCLFVCTLLASLLFSVPGMAQRAQQHLLHTREKYEEFLSTHPFTQQNRTSMSKKERKGIPKKDRPDLALEQDVMRTLDPALGYVPYERRVAALQYAEQLRRLQAAIPGVTWTERGPNNVGGRTRALMFDPNDAANGYKKVWAGGVAGGLWYNNNITSATSQWVHVDDFWDNIAISTIAYTPAEPSIFYVGTGEGWFNVDALRGGGIWKTTDGGATWTRLTSTNNTNFRTVQKIVVKANGTVVAATNVGIMRSLDRGTTWTNVLSTAGSMGDVELAANGDLFAGSGLTVTPGKVFKSTAANNGNTGTWTEVTTGLPTTFNRIELATAPSDANVVYLVAEGSNAGVDAGGGLYKTTNGGTSWTAIALPVDADPGIGAEYTRGQAWYDLSLIVDPTNANTVFTGGIDLFKTTDGGTSWAQITHWYGGFGFQEVHADQHSIAYKPNTLASTEMVFSNDGGVYYTSNATAAIPTISARNMGYNVTQFYSCAAHPAVGSNHFLAGAQDNGTQKFSTTGINSTTEVIGGDGAFCFIDQDQPNIQIGSYTNNNYYVSTDGGISFISRSSSNTGSFINPCDYDSRINALFSASSSTAIRRMLGVGTTNTNSTVTLALGATASHIKVSPYAPAGTATIFVGTSAGKIYKITNMQGTPVLTNITGNLTVAGSVSCIDLGGSENRLLVTFSNYGVNSVWESTNGGTTWVSKEDNLPDMPVRWCLYNPDNYNQVLLATEVGVWSTNDISGTPGWQPTNNGLANTRIDMLKYRASDKTIVAATHGRGLYTTNIFSTPTAEFSATPLLTYTNKNIQFTDASIMATSWFWEFGDGGTSTQPNPVYAYTAPGRYTVKLTINGSLAVTKTSYIHILPDRPIPYLAANGGNFETNINDFGTLNVSGTPFERGNSTVIGKNGTTSGANAWVTGLTLAEYADNSDARLYTPSFNLGSAGNYSIEFKTNYSFETGFDGFIVEYSLNKGDTWTKLNGPTSALWFDATAASSSPVFTPNQPYFGGVTNGYVQKSLDISSLAGNASVAFRFAFKTDDSVLDIGMAVDDFQLIGVDNSAPLVVTLSPANGATNVAPATNLVMTFNEPIQKGTGNILLKENGVVTQTIPVGNANVTVSGTTVTIDPAANFTAGAVVNVEMAAGVFKDMSNNNFAGLVSTATGDWRFTIATLAINQPPVFTKGADQVVNEDAGAQTVNPWATGIDDGDPALTQNLNFTVVNSNPTLFSVQPAISATGVLTYTPAANANGTASLTVSLVDDGSNVAPNANTSAPQDFTITVNPVNDAPVFVKGADQVVADIAGAQTIANWATSIGDGDPELTQTLTFSLTNNNNALFTAQPALSPSGTLTYTPAIGANGTATVTIVLTDNGSGVAPNVNTAATQTFLITVTPVNQPPVFTKGADQVVNEDAGAQTVANWATGIDDGDVTMTQVVNFTLVNSNPALFSVQPAINATGRLTYTPAPNANGTASITVRLVDDGSAIAPSRNTSAPQDFTITVNPINDAPSFIKGADQTVAMNAPGQAVNNWAISVIDGDPEITQTLTFTLTNNNNALFSVQPSLSAGGTLTYTPAPGAFGVATVDVVLQDNGSGVAPNVNTAPTETFTITVTGNFNQPPTFTRGANQVVNEDAGAQVVGNWATNIDDGDPTQTQVLHFVVVNSNPALFSVQPGISPTGTLNYTPAPNANGTASVTVRLVDDGLNTPPHRNNSVPQDFAIVVNPVNDAPSFVKGANQTVFDVAGSQTVFGWATAIEDGDPEIAQSTSFTLTNNNNSLFAVQPAIDPAGTLTFAPAVGANGVAVVTVVMKDNGSDVAPNVNTSVAETFTITVNITNQPPTFTAGSDQVVDEDAVTQVVGNWATAINDGNPTLNQVVNFTVVNSNPALFNIQPSLSSTGTLTYRPAANASGTASVTVRLVDDGANVLPHRNTSLSYDFSIIVNPINDAPRFVGGADQVVYDVAGTQSIPGWAVNIDDGDPELVQNLNFIVTNTNNSLFVVQPAISPNGTLTFTPALHASGTAVVSVAIQDNGSGVAPNVNISAVQTFNITVNLTNQPPVFTKGADQAVDEDATLQTVSNWATGIDDGNPTITQTMVFSVVNSNPALFSLQPSLTAGGQLTYSPVPNANGTASLTVRLTDNGSNVSPHRNTSLSQDFTITVNPVNDAPTFTQGANLTVINTMPHTIMNWATAINDGDPEISQLLSFTLLTNSNAGLFTVQPSLNSAGVLSFTPVLGATGTATLTVVLTDNGSGVAPNVNTSVVKTFSITLINCVNPNLGVAITNLESSYCKGGAAVTLTGTPAGGNFFVNNVPSAQFNPSALAIGNHVVMYAYKDPATNCVDTARKTVAVVDLPVVSITGMNPTYCVNDAVITLAGSPTGGVFRVDGNVTLVFDPAALGAGNHTILYTYQDPATQCSNSVSKTVTIYDIPTVSILQLNSEYCISSPSVTLQGSPAGGSFKVNGSAATRFSPASLGIGSHTVIYTYKEPGTNCTVEVTKRVEVKPVPTVNLGADLEACSGDGAVRLAPQSGSSTAGLTYLWNTGATTAAINVAQAGTYILKATDPATGCSGADTIKVAFNQSPVFAFSGVNAQGVCSKKDTITIQATNVLNMDIVWSGPGIVSTSTDKLSIIVDKTGNYVATLTDKTKPTKCKTTQSVYVFIADFPELTLTSRKYDVCQDSTISLDATAPTHLSTYKYQWRELRSGSVLANTAKFSLGYSTIRTFDPVKYEITVTPPSGCGIRDTFEVAFRQKAVATIQKTYPARVCIGQPVVLKAVEGAGYKYKWQGQTSTASTVTVIPDKVGIAKYVLEVTSGNNCKPSYDTATVVVNPKMAVEIKQDTISLCENATVTLDANHASHDVGTTYSWKDTRNGNIVGTAAIQKFAFDAIRPQPTYAQITYEVTATNPNTGCSAKDTVKITFIRKAKPKILTFTTSVCVGDSVRLTASGGANYVWSNGATTGIISVSNDKPGSYTYILKAQFNQTCDPSYDTITLNVVAKPIAKAHTAKEISLCYGSSTTLSASGGVRYLWSHSRETKANIVVAPKKDTKYVVTVFNETGCSSNDTVLVKVTPAIDLPGKIYGCEGQPVTINATSPVPARYLWNDGDTSAIRKNILKGRKYIVTVTVNTCSYSDTTEVIFRPTPRISLNRDTLLCFANADEREVGNRRHTHKINAAFLNRQAGETYFYEVVDSAGGVIDRDRIEANNLIPINAKKGVGRYIVRVKNSAGCTSTDTMDIREVCEPRVKLPDAFTPNADMLNDVFAPVTSDMEGIRIRIFQRWGTIVYEKTLTVQEGWNGTFNEAEGWDGTYLGKPCAVDAYQYVIEYWGKDAKGQELKKSLTGTIHLIRDAK